MVPENTYDMALHNGRFTDLKSDCLTLTTLTHTRNAPRHQEDDIRQGNLEGSRAILAFR